jgi:hypothetical protein
MRNQLLDQIGLSDIEPEAVVNPAMTPLAVATGQEAPVLKQQRKQTDRKHESLSDLYKRAKQESAESDPEEDRKTFKWSDMSDDQKNDTLLRLGLNLMQHAPGGLGLSGWGKAGSETLSYIDQMREADRKDARTRRESAKDEGKTLADLAATDRRFGLQEDQFDLSAIDILPTDNGYVSYDKRGGQATPIEGVSGPVARPSGSRDSAWRDQLETYSEYLQSQGAPEAEAKRQAFAYAKNDTDHVDPRTRLQYRQFVKDNLNPYDKAEELSKQLGRKVSKAEAIEIMTNEMIARDSGQKPQ